MAVQAVVFDAYGTLFDVYSISALAEKLFRGNGEKLAALWRRKQIEYTQLRTLCSTYKPFWEVTQDALVYSCRSLGLDLDLKAQHALMSQYAKLEPFAECADVLEQLKSQGFKLAVLSNGNPEMLSTVVKAAGLQARLSHLLSVDSVRKFKTAPEAYQLGPDIFGLPPKNMLFVSSNCWDICGAGWFGYKTFWVNRSGTPIEELGVVPNGEGRSLSDLLPFLREMGAPG